MKSLRKEAWTHLRLWLKAIRISSPYEGLGLWRSLLASSLVGVAAGCGAVLLVLLLQFTTWLFLGHAAGFMPQFPAFEPHLIEFGPLPVDDVRRWVVLVLPAAGALVSGWLVLRLAPEAEGHGTDSAIEAYHFRDGKIRARVPPVKSIASAILIGTGGSAGLEGPISQIGAGFGSILAGLLRFSTTQRRLLMAAGMAGGVGALFHAPMAGALFAAEVLYRDLDLEYEVLVPSIVSSITAHAVFSSVFGFHPLFQTPEFHFGHPRELLAYLLLAGVIAAGSRFYTWTFYAVHEGFRKLRIRPVLKPALGGLLTGLVAFVFLPALGTGYGSVQRALVHGTDLAPVLGTTSGTLLLAVFLVKTVTTAFSVGSGGAGGIFGPAIVAGGALGGAMGVLFQHLLPGWHLSVGAFTMLGMVSFFGCIANTPISTILMVSEMTGNYRLLVPAMWVCILAYVLNRQTRLYRSQLPNRFDSPVHRGSMMAGILRNLHADEILSTIHRTFTTVQTRTPALELARLATDSKQSAFPVVDDAGALVGVATRRSLAPLLAVDAALWQTLLVDDLVDPAAATVVPGDTLQTILRRMEPGPDSAIVVCDGQTPPHPIGILGHRDVMDACRTEVATHR